MMRIWPADGKSMSACTKQEECFFPSDEILKVNTSPLYEELITTVEPSVRLTGNAEVKQAKNVSMRIIILTVIILFITNIFIMVTILTSLYYRWVIFMTSVFLEQETINQGLLDVNQAKLCLIFYGQSNLISYFMIQFKDAKIFHYYNNFQKTHMINDKKVFYTEAVEYDEIEPQKYENYRQFAFNPVVEEEENLGEKVLNEKARQIFEWAKNKGAKYYTFFGYPQTEGVLEKQETFLDLNFFYEQTLQSRGTSVFSFLQLGKGQGDGSSFPSGGLRETHKARAYTIWDQRSEVFLRKKSNVLYIPSLLVTHDGQALDDKTLFRKAEIKLEQASLTLLKQLGKKASAVKMALGLEQEFFIITKEAYQKRLDLRNTGRTLIGKLPPKHQQFSDHYYGKIPMKIEQILQEIQNELLEIGVPCKTRHKQVAPNQFQFCPLYQEAGKSIDQNMIMMEILKEKFEEHGLFTLFHQKPFCNLNGSGKHCNWSLNYVDEKGEINNLFKIPKTAEDTFLFKVFILIHLKALLKYGKLYLAAVSVCGNELRLGGHQAPPRIISAFLGSTVSEILDDMKIHQRVNLRQQLPNINFDIKQEDTDRNRTSPYAYTGNKFEFRAVGSSQNVSFVMAVIAATITKQIIEVSKRLEKGEEIQNIMVEMLEETKPVRFSGNGYSQEWVDEATKRGLYVNDVFIENIENVKEQGMVFVEIGAASKGEILAKYQNMCNVYENTVRTEANCLLSIMGSEIIPRCYEFLRLVEPISRSERINKRSEKFLALFEELLEMEEVLKEQLKNAQSLSELSSLREKVGSASNIINKILEFIPKNKNWPEYEDFIHIY